MERGTLQLINMRKDLEKYLKTIETQGKDITGKDKQILALK